MAHRLLRLATFLVLLAPAGVPKPAEAALSCEMAGWIGAVIANSARATGPASTGRETTLKALLATRDPDLLRARLGRDTDPADAAVLVAFFDAIYALRDDADMMAGLHKRSVLTARGNARHVLLGLTCAPPANDGRAADQPQDAVALSNPEDDTFIPRETPKEPTRLLSPTPLRVAMIFLALVVVVGGSVMVMRVVTRRQSRRKRYPCDLPCAFSIAGRNYSGQLIDVSQSGCKLSTSSILQKGTRMSLSVDTLDIEAQVIWNKAGAAGLEFRERLEQDRLMDILEEARAHRRQTARMRRLAHLTG